MSEERRKFIRELKSLLPGWPREALLALRRKAGAEPAKAVCHAGEAEKAEPANASPSQAVGAEREAPRPVLHISSLEDWQKLRNALLNIGSLKEAARYTEKAEHLVNALTRFEGAVRRTFARAPERIEEDSTEKTAWTIIQLLGDYLSNMLSYLESNLQSPDVARMAKTLDAYLASLCIEKHELHPQSSMKEWVDLNMSGDAIVTRSTKEAEKNGKISEIYIQPRVIRYMNAFAETAQQYFLGSCCVYKLKA